jgi:cell division protein FtsB
LWCIRLPRGRSVRKKLVVILAAAVVCFSGLASCGQAVEHQVRQRVEDKVQQGKQRAKEEVEKGKQRLEQEGQKAKQGIEREVQKAKKKAQKQMGKGQ